MKESHGFERGRGELYGRVCREKGEEGHDAIIIFKENNKVEDERRQKMFTSSHHSHKL